MPQPDLDARRKDHQLSVFSADIGRQARIIDSIQRLRAAAEGGDMAAQKKLLDLSGRPWESQRGKVVEGR